MDPETETRPMAFAIRADGGNGYFAVAGKRQANAATAKADRATTWATREAAEAALPAIAEAAPGFFGPVQSPLVVDLTPAPARKADAAPAGESLTIACLECGAVYPWAKSHLIDAGGMGCVRCNH